MGLNETPSGERVHIGFFGQRNAGKSSLVNAVTGQELAVVSDTRGTTTGPVSKAMELLPIGPVVIIDTPGFDDEGALGELRVRKTKQVLNKTDIAVLVVDATEGKKQCDEELIRIFKENYDDFFAGRAVQTDGSSVVLMNIATLNDARVDMVTDSSVNWYIDYNYENLENNSKDCRSCRHVLRSVVGNKCERNRCGQPQCVCNYRIIGHHSNITYAG